MQDQLIIYSAHEINSRVRHRQGETKIGDLVNTISDPENWKTELKNSSSKYIVLGLPEDIGVRANYGRGGAYAAWKPSLDFLINMQSNQFLSGDEILILGHVYFDDLMEIASSLNYKLEADIIKARKLVEQVDERVVDIIKNIISAGKIPIVIGGGHNNAYPIIKGVSIANNSKPINVINCDPHSDMRPMNGRHSGNGFLFAFEENYLDKYVVFGLHESYNISFAMDMFRQYPNRLAYESYDNIFVRESINYYDALRCCFDFFGGDENAVGIEIDLDSIQNVPVSARTPSGMLPVDVRKYVWFCAENLNAAYLHIAEGAPVLAHKQVDNKTGKLIAYIITDFIKAMNSKNI
jgi:formiminoglutamase